MKNLKNSKGFTLMEMLIVVAIIALLVAIAIPSFTKQLEKAREAADMANLRSAYAQLMADVIENTSDGGANAGTGSEIYVRAKQKLKDWQSGGEVDIGNVKDVEASTTYWKIRYEYGNNKVSISPVDNPRKGKPVFGE